MKLLVVYMEKKYLLGFKLLMMVLAIPVALEIIDIISSGSVVNSKGKELILGEESYAFYSKLIKEIAIFVLFSWLGTFGSKVKRK